MPLNFSNVATSVLAPQVNLSRFEYAFIAAVQLVIAAFAATCGAEVEFVTTFKKLLV